MSEPEIPEPHPDQIILCTNDDQCKANADEHLDTCPVEAELKATFGY